MSTRIPLPQVGVISNQIQSLINWLRRPRYAFRPILQFMVVSLTIIIIGMGLVGWWIASQIEQNVVDRTSKSVAVYIDSLLAPVLQDLAAEPSLSVGSVRELQWLLNDTGVGRQIVALKIWDKNGRILYSDDPNLIGLTFPVEEDLAESWGGAVTGEISALENAENVRERAVADRLLEIYAPVRARGSNEIIAVVEFYQRVEELESAIQRSQQASWLAVFTAGVTMYALLVSYVAQLSYTVAQQRIALGDQVRRLTNLLRLNRELDGRVRRAAVRTTELNERYQRRISSELHDGPAQYLGLALLRLDKLDDLCNASPNPAEAHRDVEVIRSALAQTMQEVRSICSGLGLPNLDRLSLQACIERAIRAHERATGTSVSLSCIQIPDDAPLSVKITTYRVIQEALTNAHRHADGVGQEVIIRGSSTRIQLEVIAAGPGITIPSTTDWSEHMGLSGMRERVESNGGIFRIESRPGFGTRIFADLPLAQDEEQYD